MLDTTAFETGHGHITGMLNLHVGKAFIFPLNSAAICFDLDLAFFIFQLLLTMKYCTEVLMERNTPEFPCYNVFPI